MADRPTNDNRSEAKRAETEPSDDTIRTSLSKDDRRRLGIDAWEPSLLRELLTAQNRLQRRK